MRPCHGLIVLLLLVTVYFTSIVFDINNRRMLENEKIVVLQGVVSFLGISDLALSTEARYLRHAVVSDPLVPWMDHPCSIEHFPSSLIIEVLDF